MTIEGVGSWGLSFGNGNGDLKDWERGLEAARLGEWLWTIHGLSQIYY